MPLRLKSLELHGYKTFASRIRFEFSDKITAIVGPNGSGKSNIADALRWALGEQSYSILRGKKTEDMIFAGSENRPKAGMASVSINFDNSDNWLPIDFSEVDVSRRAYRDGRNDYLVNNQHVRLRDLNELLSQSGLSQRTYTILGQGLVDASLALKADERRKLFEEAAGIGLYQSRRNEALKRLDITNRNLDRVLDILAELQPRLKSLEKQAKKAKQYQQVQIDLQNTIKEWYGYHWKKSQREMNEAREVHKNHAVKLEEARHAYQSIRGDFSSYREKLHNLRSKLNTWHSESSELHSQRELVSREMAVLDERRKSLEENRKDVLLEIGRLDVDIEALQNQHERLSVESEKFHNEYKDSLKQLDLVQEALQTSKVERLSIEQELNIATKENTNFRNKQIQLKAQEEELRNRAEYTQSELEALNLILTDINGEEKELSKNHKLIIGARTQLEKQFIELQEGIEKLRKNLVSLESSEVELSKNIDVLNINLSRLEAQKNVLTQSEESFIGYEEGARILLKSAREKKIKANINGMGSAMDVPREFEKAITASLGDFVDSLMLQSDQDLNEVITKLDLEQEGRATLLPLDKLKYENKPKINIEDGVLGLATDLITIKHEYKTAVEYFLNQTIVVRDRKIVAKILNKVPENTKIVTLNGDLFYASGPIRLGKKSDAGILSRRSSIKEIEKQLSEIDEKKQKLFQSKDVIGNEIIDLQVEIQKNETQFRTVSDKLDEVKNDEINSYGKVESNKHKKELHQERLIKVNFELQSVNQKLEEAIAESTNYDLKIQDTDKAIIEQKGLLSQIATDDLTEKVTYWSAQVAVIKHSFEESANRNEELQNRLVNLNLKKNNLNQRYSGHDESITEIDQQKLEMREREVEFSIRLEKLQNLIKPAEIELENTELKESQLQENETKSQSSLGNVERYNNQIQLDFERKQEAVENLRQKIEDDFGLVSFEYASNVDGPVPLPFDGLVEQLVVLDVLPPDLEETLTHQRMLLRRLGPVNPEANEEYDSVAERHMFLETQLEDLKKAVIDTEKVISELDEITRQEFFKTYTAVAEEFKAIFHRLFGGGSARLTLTDPENLNDTGIDIEAQLPGRREQGLALLSGGERSLTAIALIFSLLKVSPTPVCVMDEVDAMLDEVNVGRFRDLLQELSQDTQFIIITHNRNTVQAADIIYGVTMGMDSVSQIISLKLDEISDEILLGGRV